MSRPQVSALAKFTARMRWVRRRFARATDRVARMADPLCRSWWAIATVSFVIATVPALAAISAPSSLHQVLSAVGLAPFVWSCARRDDWARGMTLLSATFVIHSLTLIAITVYAPETGSSLVPGGDEYWLKQLDWITTGRDPEYELRAWGPAHVQLLCGTTLFSMTSLGAITLHQGFHEVDLMNFYNGQLIRISRHPLVALTFGWHLWSMLRGCGYVVLTFEIVSLSLQMAIGRRLATKRVRCVRWLVGVGFLILDGLAKWFLLELVRQQLSANLL